MQSVISACPSDTRSGNAYSKLHKLIVPTSYAEVLPTYKNIFAKKVSPCFQIQLQKMPELVK